MFLLIFVAIDILLINGAGVTVNTEAWTRYIKWRKYILYIYMYMYSHLPGAIFVNVLRATCSTWRGVHFAGSFS